MLIHGLQKMTLVDYPGKVAAILFTGACNFRCPFCQNAALVLHPDTEDVIPEDEIFSYLRKRKGLLDGVVITGGEPTLAPDLLDYIKRIKDIGYSVKLDTNGYRPDVMAAAVESGVDYIAMDIKNSLDKYPETAGIANFEPSRSLVAERFNLRPENARIRLHSDDRQNEPAEIHLAIGRVEIDNLAASE